MRPQVHDPMREPAEDGTDDEDDEERRTIFCANFDQRVNEEILFEVFIQAGPIESVRIPKDNGGRPKSFGFITYVHQCSVPFAMKLLAGLSLYNKQLTIKTRSNKAYPSDIEPLLLRPRSSGASEFIPMRGASLSYQNEVNPFKADLSPTQGQAWTNQRRSDELKKHSSHNSRPHQNNMPYSRPDNSRDHGGGGGSHRKRHGRRARNR